MKWPKKVKRQGEARTFEDEYKLFKKTGGRQGWSPNPKHRPEENPVYLASKSVFGGIKFNWRVRGYRKPRR